MAESFCRGCVAAMILVCFVAPLSGAVIAEEKGIIGGISGKSTTDLKAEASDRLFSGGGYNYNRPAAVYGAPGISSSWLGYNGYNQGIGGGYNGIRGYNDGYSGVGGVGSYYDGYQGSGVYNPGYNSIGYNKFGSGGYGGFGGNGGLYSYNGYNNPSYYGSNNLGYGYYNRNNFDGGYAGGAGGAGGYYGGKGGLGLGGITPSYVTGYRGYT